VVVKDIHGEAIIANDTGDDQDEDDEEHGMPDAFW
jgi:hypothetical protein